MVTSSIKYLGVPLLVAGSCSPLSLLIAAESNFFDTFLLIKKVRRKVLDSDQDQTWKEVVCNAGVENQMVEQLRTGYERIRSGNVELNSAGFWPLGAAVSFLGILMFGYRSVGGKVWERQLEWLGAWMDCFIKKHYPNCRNVGVLCKCLRKPIKAWVWRKKRRIYVHPEERNQE